MQKKFPVQSWSAERKTNIRCGHPFSGSAPSRAGCIQSGFPYQKTCTACNCAVQLHNWDTSPAGQSQPAKAQRRMRTARQNAAPASWASGDRTSRASSAAAARCALRHQSPCSPVVYTSWPLKNLFIGFGNGFEDTGCSHHRTIPGQAPARLSRFSEDTIPGERGACLPARKQQSGFHLLNPGVRFQGFRKMNFRLLKDGNQTMRVTETHRPTSALFAADSSEQAGTL